jgi:hypothetical protein
MVGAFAVCLFVLLWGKETRCVWALDYLFLRRLCAFSVTNRNPISRNSHRHLDTKGEEAEKGDRRHALSISIRRRSECVVHGPRQLDKTSM